MYRKTYYCMQKYRWKDGSVHYYRKRYKKWVKSSSSVIKKRRSHINREPLVIFSKRFGYIDVYNRREQNYLMCPSGFSFTQGMGKLYKLWRGYIIAKANEKDIERARGFAKDIQKVQEDLGIKTTSFPHLGLYGDIFTLYERKNKKAVREDHSELKENQELLEKKYEIITIADEMNKIFKEERQKEKEKLHEVEPVDIPAKVPILLVPTPEQEIQIFTDDTPVTDERKPLKSKLKLKLKQSKKNKVIHENRITYRYNFETEIPWTCEECGEKIEPHTLIALKSHVCKNKNELEIVTMTDDVPFQ